MAGGEQRACLKEQAVGCARARGNAAWLAEHSSEKSLAAAVFSPWCGWEASCWEHEALQAVVLSVSACW